MKKVTCRGHVWKIDLYNKKTKIYQIIKGLIILFIKLQFSIRYNQAFRPLHTSTSNIYLNFSLNLNGLVICIIYIRIISNTSHDSRRTHNRGLYTSNQVRSRLTYLSGLAATDLRTKRPSLFLSLTWHSWRQSWRPYKREVLAASSWTYIHTATKGCSRVIHLTPRRVGDLQEG